MQKLKEKILEQSNDITLFDKLTESKTPSSRQVILKYKVVCESLAWPAKWIKNYPIKYPKLMRARKFEQDNPGVGTYRSQTNKVSAHVYHTIFGTSNLRQERSESKSKLAPEICPEFSSFNFIKKNQNYSFEKQIPR